MSSNSIVQCLLFWGIILALVKPLGSYIARVYNDQCIFLESILGPLEDFSYRIAKIDPSKEMVWHQYATAVVLSSFGGFLFLFLILRFQAYLPLNPEHFPNLTNDLAFNTAASFITNTCWVSYSGESTLSYLSQMLGLTVQCFLSASMGMAVAIALIRGIVRKNSKHIGNFWVDWVRGNLYILLPLSLILAIALGSQGVIQNFNSYISATLIAPFQDAVGNSISTQTIPGGPVASQVAIMQLGSAGGGFFNTNAAHPFANPTPFSNFLQMLALILIPAALCYTFGVMANDKRQGWAILLAMSLIYLPLCVFGIYKEQQGNTLLSTLASLDQTYNDENPGGNLEGKELRFGIVNSTLWSSTTTATANGSVNAMLDSYTPLGGLVPLIFLLLGEVIFGGVGAGLYGILIFILVTVFVAGLMVGRTPEFLGKKIQSYEIKMTSIAIFVPIMMLLFGSAICVLSKSGLASVFNPQAQGFTEILYALASCAGNNGSAFAGLDANTPFYNTLLAMIMLFSRFWVMIPILAIAGALAEKNVTPYTSGTLSTNNLLFILLLIGIIVLVGLLTYFPAIMLAPISEYFHMEMK
ncbi:MAG: potassium-transporting ATPase subunit KdpA [Proteobacteria bacterium]|nr:potassium-transporting ATPase subunit KdpA [Pseudomonadota bacterium]